MIGFPKIGYETFECSGSREFMPVPLPAAKTTTYLSISSLLYFKTFAISTSYLFSSFLRMFNKSFLSVLKANTAEPDPVT